MKCHLCNYKVHIKCNDIDDKTYNTIKDRNESWICLSCNTDIFPFFLSHESKSSPKEPQFHSSSNSLKAFFKGINEFNNNQIRKFDDTDYDNVTQPISCQYVDVDSFRFQISKKDLPLFHLNISSLRKHKDELETNLSLLNLDFKIIGLTETKIKKKQRCLL